MQTTTHAAATAEYCLRCLEVGAMDPEEFLAELASAGVDAFEDFPAVDLPKAAARVPGAVAHYVVSTPDGPDADDVPGGFALNAGERERLAALRAEFAKGRRS